MTKILLIVSINGHKNDLSLLFWWTYWKNIFNIVIALKIANLKQNITSLNLVLKILIQGVDEDNVVECIVW